MGLNGAGFHPLNSPRSHTPGVLLLGKAPPWVQVYPGIILEGTFVCRAGEGTFRLVFETWAILVTAPFGMGLGKNGSTSALGATP